MWEGKESCVYPREFRSVLCDHAQQFLGYEQHDRLKKPLLSYYDPVYKQMHFNSTAPLP